ncbi:MAG TPA: DUF5985 family protein [Burkholderiales bacterium]|nr:DUF5985 family protein [Burkholderiales bacterium]
MGTINLVLTLLASLTSLICTLLLFRAYAHNGLRLLLWSALCFVCLTANNVLLFFDLVVFTDVDLRLYRMAAALAGILFLLYAFIWEAE